MPQIIHERPEDAVLIEPLLDTCFGPERVEKTAYKIRACLTKIPELSFVVRDGADLIATIRYWPLVIAGKTAALLLGPIAVQPERQGQKIGVSLIQKSLAVATELGHKIVVLVGDPEYYEQFGFQSASALGFKFPGPVAARRFLIKELKEGALEGVSGLVDGAPSPTLSPPAEAQKT
ncbi:MAG: GNAT family N-acetyltransferase [Sneathiella sp.]|nr:MAG: GNAT family N-acetyltransferase [Sneathiella sp.]